MRKRSEKIFEAIKETLRHSTFHGVRNIIKHQFIVIKYMWFICLLSSASYFFYAMTRLINAYLLYQVDTQIEVKYVKEVTFPLVQICRYDINIPAPSNSQSPTTDRITYIAASVFFKNLNKAKDETFHRTTGIANLSDILISCIYNFKFCNATEFGYFYDFHYGSCWQFNSGKNSKGNRVPFKSSRSQGIEGGLMMELYLGTAIDNYNLLSFMNAFEILIANETTDSTLKEGIKVWTGLSTHFTLDKFTIRTQPKPYSNCVDNLITENAYPSECYKKTLQQAIRQERLYHYIDCSYMCLQKLLTETCNCYNEICDPYYPNIERKCIALSDFLCCKNVYAEFINNRTHMDKCDCPRECIETGYSITASYGNYPTKYRADYLASKSSIVKNKFPNSSQMTHKDLEKRLTRVHVYYNDLKETKVTQKPKMALFDLIAQIGSQMFIFLGASFLSAGELAEILLQSLVIIFCTKT